jgi:glycolate oxidase iron-sulfur subunit
VESELKPALKPAAPSASESASKSAAPSTGGARRDPIDDCVHCGFCLPHCPTYRSWGQEMDSPRGRIDLMRGLRDGALSLSPAVARHFDRCLGCMACLPACPSGVRYDTLIERTRAEVERRLPRPPGERLHRALIFALFPYPRRLKAALVLLWLYVRSGLQRLVRRSGLLRRLPARLAALDALVPAGALGWRALTARLPAHRPAQGPARARVGLIAGCVQRVFFPQVNEATIRVLSAEGCDVHVPPDQGCCGALSLHAGREDEAKGFARALMRRFEDAQPVDRLVVNAAGCGSHLKGYGDLLAGEPAWAERAGIFAAKVRDVSELLFELGPLATRHPLRARAAYHDACHLAHAQGVRRQPRALLQAIPGLELLEIPDGEQCCGSAGIYNLTEPEAADEIGARKVTNLLSTRPELLVTGNPGCALQLCKILRARGIELPAAHPIELLDASIRGVGLAGRGVGRAGRGVGRAGSLQGPGGIKPGKT